MTCLLPRFSRHCLLLLFSLTSLGVLAPHADAQENEKQSNKRIEWTLDSALEHLEMYPNDAYLQYVAMQLALSLIHI